MDRFLQRVELLYLLVLKELRVRYKRSVLGYVWALAHPILFALIYSIAFQFVLRVKMEGYAVFLLTGLFPWAWLTHSIIRGTTSLTENQPLVRKVKIPLLVLPLSNIFQEMVHFVLAVPILIVTIFLLSGEINIDTSFVQLPVMLILQVLFILPIVVITGLTNVYVRDIEHLMGIAFSALFFLTPMVYPLSMVPKDYQYYFELNPAYWLIDSWRIVFSGNFIPRRHIFSLLVFIFLSSILAFVAHKKLSRRVAEVV